MILEYETLKLLWWLFVVVLLVGFALLDGFDLGVGALLPFLGKTDLQRRVMINTIGPTWEGNQVWFITAGGALFAAWPLVYAAAFSGLYFAMLTVLFALILRPVGFDFRSKVPDPRWRNMWDWCLFAGGAVPALVFGVAVGNLLQGLPFHYEEILRPVYTGSFLALFNPFALLCGFISLAMVVEHGAMYIVLRTQDDITIRARVTAQRFAWLFIAGFAVAGIWISTGIEGMRVTSMPDVNTSFTPLDKEVAVAAGQWLENYRAQPWLWLLPASAVGGALLVVWCARAGRAVAGFLASCLMVASTVLTPAVAMFPFVMPSSTHPAQGLTMWDATSSALTLQWMFFAVVVFLPIIIAYTSWVYRVLRGKVTEAHIEENTHSVY